MAEFVAKTQARAERVRERGSTWVIVISNSRKTGPLCFLCAYDSDKIIRDQGTYVL